MSASWGSTNDIEDIKIARRLMLVWGWLAVWGLSVLFASIKAAR